MPFLTQAGQKHFAFIIVVPAQVDGGRLKKGVNF